MEDNNLYNKKRLHFGDMIATLDDITQRAALNGIYDFARLNDIDMTIYVGMYQNIDDVNTHYETCFTAIKNNTSLDGLLILSGFVVQTLGLKKMNEELSSLSELFPIVSVSYSAPGVCTVLTDNVNGMFHAVDHLIKLHNKKNIAFIKGPEGHPETVERLEGYKMALEKNAIEFNEDLILPGNFTVIGGQEAIIELIDKRDVEFDAIAASDDGTARGAMEELKSRNILIPSNVAVIGFDDDRGSDTFIPSISTVKQDFSQIGMVSAEKLLRKIHGQQTDDVTNIIPVLLARQSCGCLENDMSQEEPENIGLFAETSLLSFIYQRFTTIFHIYVPPQIIQEWVTGLIKRTIEKPFDSEGFLRMFDEIIINYNHYSDNYTPWQEAMNAYIRGLELYRDEVDSTYDVLSTLIRATSLVHDISMKSEKNLEFALDNFRTALRRATGSLVSMLDTDALTDSLQRSLPLFSLNTALVGLYQPHIVAESPDEKRYIYTVLGFDGTDRFCVQNADCTPVLYGDYSIISDFNFERERRTFFFFPLFFEDEEVGILMMPYEKKVTTDVYETLRINISTALKGISLLSTIRALSVTDELTGLYNRRGFFQLAISRLQHMIRSDDAIPVLLYMDLDGLKQINDTYGHNEGDVAISAFANILKNTLRQDDIIGRLGGDEFVVLSSVKYEGNSEQVVTRIRNSIEKYNSKKAHPYNLSTSIGSFILKEKTKESLDAAILGADSYLYEEKSEKKRMPLNEE